MKCIVRTRKTELGIPAVFIPKGVTAEELMKELYEKECNILSSDDELDEDETRCCETSAVVQTINDVYTEFFIVKVVEVER